MFIYGLIDPRVIMVRYIGYATNDERPFKHRNCLLPSFAGQTTHKSNWIRELAQSGHEYDVCHLEDGIQSHEELCRAEIWWIAYGRGCRWPLTNMMNGGQGFQLGHEHSQETRDKISQSHLGKTMSPEFCAKTSARMIGNGNLLGFKHSDATKELIGNSSTGRVMPDTARAKIAEAKIGNTYGSANKGRVVSKETREKLSIAARARYWRST